MRSPTLRRGVLHSCQGVRKHLKFDNNVGEDVYSDLIKVPRMTMTMVTTSVNRCGCLRWLQGKQKMQELLGWGDMLHCKMSFFRVQ